MSALSQRESSGLEAAELSAQFARAAAAAGGVLERTYRIGGTNLRLRYAGPALLERLSPSIEHLRADTDGADEHEVEIWDGASTGTEAPPRPPESETLPLAGIVTGLVGGKRVIYQAGLRSLSVLDEEANRSWYWAADVDLVPEWDCSTPLRHILHLHLSARGVQFTHAGAVGRADRRVHHLRAKRQRQVLTSTLSTLGSELLTPATTTSASASGPTEARRTSTASTAAASSSPTMSIASPTCATTRSPNASAPYPPIARRRSSTSARPTRSR